MNIKLLGLPQVLVGVVLLFSLQSFSAKAAKLNPEEREFQSFNALHEPSGIIQLQDGRLLVVEDERSRAFVLLTPQSDALTFNVEVVRPRTTFTDLLSGSSAQISDLEGLVQGPEEFIYAITSHSRQSNGKRDADREKLVRLKIDGDRIEQFSVRTDLRQGLLDAFPEFKEAAKERDVKDEGGLNIEGLTFNRDQSELWIGFRAPLLNNKAILVSVRNPQRLFDSDESIQFEEKLQFLDLDGGGIRDIVFDSTLDGYLIVSQREGTKSEKDFKLWFWDGSSDASVRRVKIKGIKNLQRTEGITSLSFDSQNLLLLVSDEGNARAMKSAKVLLVNYDALKID